MILLAIEPPVLTPYYAIIKWVLIIEMALVAIVGITAILFQWLLVRRRKRSMMLVHETKTYFLGLVNKKHPFAFSQFPSRLRDISAVLAAIVELDKEEKDPQWGLLKREICREYLLPQARNLIKRPHWTSKLKALRCFIHYSEHKDENAILRQLNHKIPVVRFTAAHAAIKIGTDNALFELINVMNSSSRFLRQPVREALLKGGEKTFLYVEKRLESETDPYARLSCIEIAKERMNDHIVSLIEKDLHAEHKNLRIGAIKALGHYKNPRSARLLIPLLQDPEWEVRALAARSLGYQEAKESASALETLLKDQTWWVRMNSALALKRLGSEGIEILKGLQPDTDLYAYEAAHYVLSVEGE
ncbi:MAG: HEAT repeat domain-containing protein [Chlamydiales bacterium]|nr:HEAT repeat domain-containing protein [Chlamydiales bacterium]